MRRLTILWTLLFVFSSSAEECYPLKSLRAIYGSENRGTQTAQAIVGVIGSGIDYNHPGLARFLAARVELESGLQKLEASPLTRKPVCEYQKIQESQHLGFPIWMDQALGSPWPMDEVIQDGILQHGKEHETRVASRIIHGREDVALHFVRRMYGRQMDVFNAFEVIENLTKRGVQIINMSFGSACGVLPYEELAWSQIFASYPQIIFVIAAGNSGNNLDFHAFCPAMYSRNNANVITVTSVAPDGGIAINFDIDIGREILANYGMSVDVAIKSNSLPVLVPHRYAEGWIVHETGWTSHAAAEVSRILAHAIADGYVVDPQKVKEQLISTSRKNRNLREFAKSGGEVDEAAFRASLTRP